MGSAKQFSYVGRTDGGRPVSGTLRAETVDAARRSLARDGIVASTLFAVPRPVGSRKDPTFLLTFTSQLALLLRAGISLTAALDMLARQERNRRRRTILGNMLEEIYRGRYLHEVLGDFCPMFDEPFCQMVKAGELAGDLPAVLEALAVDRRRARHARTRMISALIHPILVLAVAVIAIFILCGHVLPHFQAFFQSQPLPSITVGLLAFGQFLHRHGLVLLMLPPLVMVLCIGLGRTAGGRTMLSRLPLLIPVVGPLLLRQYLIPFLRTFSIALRHGIPHNAAFALGYSVVPGTFLRNQLRTIALRSSEGVPLAEILAPFPAAAAGLLAVGEGTGNLAAMAACAADLLEEEVALGLERLAAVLRPLAVIFLALLVGWIAIALFLPISQLTQLQNFG
ncbi:MAG: type II secretion system F family protein [Puniceicoccales bacterium]|jgi:type II secretory pathway component PulF|nr:type II secretion system F family protein [Puniceicoccales bacterium]